MRGFILLALLAAAQADVGGYNYASAGSGTSSLSSSSSGSIDLAAPVSSEFNKEFYTYSAPEIDFDEGKNIGDIAASLKKNLRVLFIRTPEHNGLEQAAVSLAKQAAEQQTAIYVLTKQGDLGSLAQQLQNMHRVSASRPEVHFVKYRTQEDALNAQRTIQQEYDRLGGSSQSHNGGVAPVLDFTSRQTATHNTGNIGGIDPRSSAALSVSNAAELESTAAATGYLPPPVAPPNSGYLPAKKVKK